MSLRALFAGDISLDATMGIPHLPGPDEKVRMTSFFEAPGGVVTNAAVAAHLAGQEVELLLQIGNDVASRLVPPLLRDKGIALQVEEEPGMLCRAMILVDDVGEKRLLLYPGISMYPSLQAVKTVPLDRFAWLHTAIYEPVAADLLIERARQAGLPFSLDLEPVTFRDGIDALAPHLAGAEVVFCNTRAANALGADAAGRLRKLGAKSVILTQGTKGATWHGAFGTCSAEPPSSVAIIDTTGAGDCLAGWIVAERLRGAAPQEALRTAVAAASLSCGRLGAQASFPNREDLAKSTGSS
jgi:ribokinase